MVSVSLVYRKGFEKNGKAALLQYAYGSYGHSIDPAFRSTTVSLLDRGMVYAIAHIRGGQEMGRWWYDYGKLQRQTNCFTARIAVPDHLVRDSHAAPDLVAPTRVRHARLLFGAIPNTA